MSTTLFSCTADEFETAVEKTEVKKEITQPNETQATGEDEGPGDDPINVKPPKK